MTTRSPASAAVGSALVACGRGGPIMNATAYLARLDADVDAALRLRP